MNLYILECTNCKYYIGTTKKDVVTRLEEHMNKKGSAWTRKYPVKKLIKLINNCDKYDEDKWTKIYMDKYGINNVRGGSYSQVTLPNEIINLLKREVNHANQKCLFCGVKGHFINQCPSKRQTINQKYKSKNLYFLNNSCDYDSESDIESESDDEYCYESEEVWSCSYCDKEFTSKKGATYHENIYCKQNYKRKKSNTYYRKNCDYKKNRTWMHNRRRGDGDICENCGEEGHIYCN